MRILKLRNPWGSTSWKGKFKDHDPIWTDELKKILNYDPEDKEHGEFWIEYSDFIKNIENFTVCHYRDGCNASTGRAARAV